MHLSTALYGTSNDEANRHRFIRDLLHDAFPALRVESIDKMGRNNNHMHLVHLTRSGKSAVAQSSQQPGTVPFPADPDALPDHLVVRMPNEEGNNTDIDAPRKVRNEVAAMALARGTVPVPDVYLWSDEGWTFVVMQYIPTAVELGDLWEKLSVEQHHILARNVARILKAIRALPVPEMYGVLNFDADSGAIVVVADGWHTPGEMYSALVRRQLAAADANTHTRGWREQGLRERIDRFMTDSSPNGLAARASRIAGPPTMTHGDLFRSNLLVDPTTLAVVSVLDWELSRVSPPADEYFMSLAQWHFLFSLSSEDDPNDPMEAAKRTALLSGLFPSHVDGIEDWTAAKAMAEALEAEDVSRPSTIASFRDAAELYWFAEELNHWFYNLERYWTSSRSEGALDKGRAALAKNLEGWGF
ncbi:hypothetical protein EXIGLDRAFT_694176 [Exidia glandulosa HHB12029]|uniref:Aminoglycoside phosphotransferase domain-containing protein n=1 Tax=Exidia glandulosa HHB12029 TaxID=1314781 RepID=A0A165GRE5_EXIGL|nr:hypothetical protein EXIGLDRAFT_694176 [Exidia glandulosa HHB12029]